VPQTDGGNEVRVCSGLEHQKEKRSMDHFAGLDVSVKERSICIVALPSNPMVEGFCADSEEKRGPVSDVNAVEVDSQSERRCLTPNGRLEKRTPGLFAAMLVSASIRYARSREGPRAEMYR
jgi:hypothetical protein